MEPHHQPEHLRGYQDHEHNNVDPCHIVDALSVPNKDPLHKFSKDLDVVRHGQVDVLEPVIDEVHVALCLVPEVEVLFEVLDRGS